MPSSFTSFIQSFTAAIHLLNNAIKNRSALECIVLQSNLIDGLLRTGLILKRQLLNGSMRIDECLVSQADGDRKISERDVYKSALKENVIDQSTFDALSEAYEIRNRTMHRYLLCGVTYDDAVRLVFTLDHLMDRVHAIIYSIEADQIEKGVGMTVCGPPADLNYLKDFASVKENLHYLER